MSELREKVRRLIVLHIISSGYTVDELADAAIALVRADTLEEAAKVADADRIEQLEAALQRIDKVEIYEADAAVVLWAKIGIMRDIARAALEERT